MDKIMKIAEHLFSNKVVAITGANGGIGHSLCRNFLSHNATVIALDRNLDHFPFSEECTTIKCDVSSESSVMEAEESIRNEFGKCDVLINNAAIFSPVSDISQTSINSWEHLINVNLTGAFLTSKIIGKLMLNAQQGCIINIGSIGASHPSSAAAYGPSKSGLLALTRQLAVEWGPQGVRANSISPGLVRTPMSEKFYADPKSLEIRSKRIPLRRIAMPTDISNVAVFLASDYCSYINGQDLVVDGGFTLAALSNLQND